MDILVLDTNLEAIAILDMFESFIWTDRYSKCGDFELYTLMDVGLLHYIKQDYYLMFRDSEHLMIIEKLLISSDTEDGTHLTVSGRSIESVLDRRIVWGLKTYKGNLQAGIKMLLNENVISPSDPDRRIDNIVFEESDDPAITSLDIDVQWTGDNLYEIIQKICEEHKIGFKMTLSDNNKQFIFKLYAGADRSYSQTNNPYVIFSPKYENIANSNYVESKMDLKNVTLIAGEGEGAKRKYAVTGSETGLNRRELFTDARDISSNAGEGITLTEAEYISKLQQRGAEKLAENTEVESFEGEVEATLMFKYGEDFFIGDIVQVADAYGHETTARVSEWIVTQNEEGTSTYPTFETISKEGSNV